MVSEFVFPPREHRRRLIRLALVLSDGLGLTLAAWAATITRFGHLAHVDALGFLGTEVTFFDLSFVVAAIGLLAMALENLYELNCVFWGTREYRRVMRGLALAVVAFILATFALHLPGLSRAWILLSWGYGCVFMIAGRSAVREVVVRMHRRGHLMRPALIVGMGAEGTVIVRTLRKDPSSGLVPVAYLAASAADEELCDGAQIDLPCLGHAGELGRVLDERVIDTVVVCSAAFSADVVERLLAELRGRDIDIRLSAGLLGVRTSRLTVRETAGFPVIAIRSVAFSPARRAVKRAFDTLIAGTIAIIGLPLWVLIALAIKWESPGPVFFRQRRVGLKGETFELLKFRSMRSDVEVDLGASQDRALSANIVKLQADPRVTRVGRILRRYSLDEFPQLINVLIGEMSLVGPRPEQQCEVDCYEGHHMRRLDMLPGLTGLWQVSGRSDLSVEEKMRLDLYYVENWSLSFDIALLLRTVPAVLLAKGAY